MGTVTLAFPGVRVNGMAAGILGAVFTTPNPVGTVTTPPPPRAVPVEVYEEMDLVDLAIFSVVALVSLSQLLILIRITSKILSVGTFCINLPC